MNTIPLLTRLEMTSICATCGQFHESNGPHLYDYQQPVDEDLVCHICLQALVNPVDTKCGHTFCSRCIKNYLRIQKMCPVDRLALTYKECQQASIMVRRLLDKLLVVCPNVDYCEEVLPRSDLEAHLLNRCKGAITKCIKATSGCTYKGPRSALQSHMWECPYRDLNTALPKLPVLDGEVTSLDIHRGHLDLGISIVGGCDTPLMCIVIQDICSEGVVAKDGRLRQGDQILEVNGEDLTQATHIQARIALSQPCPSFRFTVYREKAEESQPIEKEEIMKITLVKSQLKQLGIKLVGKKNGPGLYVLDLIHGGLAAADGRIRKDDRILEINCQDLSYGTQEQAAQIIAASIDKVQFVVSRKSRPQTPDLIRSTSRDCIDRVIMDQDRKCGILSGKGREKYVTIAKDPSETLGISVAGGYGSQRGDVPVYVTNIQPTGCVGRNRQVKKGDVILSINGTSLLDLTHSEAVQVFKTSSASKSVSLKIVEGSETSEGTVNFTPSWVYWLKMPDMCQTIKTISLKKGNCGSLGFSIVGGCDSPMGSQPFLVKFIVPNTPTAADGRLRCGDLILTVNNCSLDNITHANAVALLKHTQGEVTLRVVSWPGTLV